MAHYTGMFKLFPIPNSSEDGFVIYDKDVIRQSVVNLINTHKGSRVYDPNYGTDIHKLIYEMNIQRTRNIAKSEITEAVKKYEPRAEILDVTCAAGTGEEAHIVTVSVKLKYVEYGEEDELKIRLVGESSWVKDDEDVHYNPAEEWFKKV